MKINLGLSVAVAGMLLHILQIPGCSTRELAEKEKPNFVWIISEDNSKHYLELFDPNGIATPHIEKLAEQGILENLPVLVLSAKSDQFSIDKAFEKGAFFPNLSIRGKIEAIIIAVMAVLDMIIEANAVANIIPKSRFLGLVPKNRIVK